VSRGGLIFPDERFKEEPMTSEGTFIKNVTFAEPLVLTELVDYQEGRVVSRTFAQNSVMSLTLFAFDKGEGLSSHTAAGDAFVHIIDGEAQITIGGKEVQVRAGQVVAMPAQVPHSLHAAERFKMLLVVVKGD
jgi:quercetin dioxygenase-like cupin family protein